VDELFKRERMLLSPRPPAAKVGHGGRERAAS
jgi:hypothetical protein